MSNENQEGAGVQEQKARFCASCGEKLNEGAKFCAGCGAQVGSAAPAAPSPSGGSGKSKKRPILKYIILGLAGLILVAVAGGIINVWLDSGAKRTMELESGQYKIIAEGSVTDYIDASRKTFRSVVDGKVLFDGVYRIDEDQMMHITYRDGSYGYRARVTSGTSYVVLRDVLLDKEIGSIFRKVADL